MSDEEITVAQRNLARFALEQAEAVAVRLGFRWRASTLATSSFVDLLREHRACELSGLPLRVSALHCMPSIFGSASANQAMRFWHDTSHVRLGLSFNADDEMALAAHHLEVLRAHGYSAESLEHRLLHADTSGQVLCAATLGHFPEDQLRFALRSVESGVQAAAPATAITSSFRPSAFGPVAQAANAARSLWNGVERRATERRRQSPRYHRSLPTPGISALSQPVLQGASS